VSVYAGVDPLTRQQIRLRSTVKDERLAQIELGRLLKDASDGRRPETDATVARLMDEYAAVERYPGHRPSPTGRRNARRARPRGTPSSLTLQS
jgi:hypothetical protein